MKDFLRIEQKYGAGEKKKLTVSQLKSLQRVCDNFRKLVEANSDDYAFYRCTLTSDGDIIYAVFSGANEDGNIIQSQFGYSLSKEETYCRKISFRKEAVVANALYDLIVNLMNLIPFNVGMLDFPVEGEFKEGFIMDYNQEPGTALIIVEDSLKNEDFMWRR